MCPPVSPHRGASIVSLPTHNACVFGVEAPLRGRSGGHTGAAPTVSFGWITCGWLISFGMNYAWNGWCRLGGLRVNGYFVCVGCVEKYDGDW